MMNNNSRLAAIILRWGLAFVFFYAAVAALLDPQGWIDYFPTFMLKLFPSQLLLTGFSYAQIILAAWLFWGKKLLWSSGIAILMLAGITLATLNVFTVTFRDVGLLFAAIALFELARGQEL